MFQQAQTNGAGVLGCLLVLTVGGIAGADEPSASSIRRAAALQITTDAAKAYEFELAGEPPRKLTFHPDSLLRWSNPVAGEVYGDVFVWTRDGRPELIGSFHQWYSPLTHGAHEFHSLAAVGIRGTRDGQPVWNSQRPGIQWRPVPNRPAVAATPPARLSQMRSISREFTVRKTDREGVVREMRLLRQPVYRYAPDDSNSNLGDGALFVFVQGTDPEVFLLVEARPAGGDWKWHYALARMNSVQFVAKYQDREVWRVEIWPWSRTKNGSEPYTQFGPFHRPNAAGN